jgi:hypothetical protein
MYPCGHGEETGHKACLDTDLKIVLIHVVLQVRVQKGLAFSHQP